MLTASALEINIGILLPEQERYIFHTPRINPAVDIALETVQQRITEGHYVNFSMTSFYRNTGPLCSPNHIIAAGISSRLYFENDVVAFIGPPCSFATVAVADLSAFWNVPVITGVSTSADLDNKSRFKTLTRTSYKLGSLAEFMARIFEMFQWRRCAIVWDNWPTFRLIANSIRARMLSSEYFVYDVPIAEYSSITEAVDQAANNSRGT